MRRHLRIASAVVTLAVLAGGGAAGLAAAGGHVYVVRPGDSLWAISQTNDLTVAQLAAANGMDPNEILLIGRHLYIPTAGSGVAGTPASAPASPPGADPAPGRVNPWTFCADFRSQGGPWGELPWLLQVSPRRLALQPVFDEWASYYNLSLPLLEAVAWQESGWQQGVVSPVGAVGVGQIMPGTARFISTFLVGKRMNINSASDNIRMSAAFLAYLADIEGNNPCDTIASYYEGPLNLSTHGVFTETATYVEDVEALIPRFE